MLKKIKTILFLFSISFFGTSYNSFGMEYNFANTSITGKMEYLYNELTTFKKENIELKNEINKLKEKTISVEMLNQLSIVQREKINHLENQIEKFKVSQQRCAKAWVTFNGSAQILESYGVSSVITTGTGRYTINFSSPFKAEFYCNALSARAKGLTLFATSDWEGHGTQKKESFNLLTWHHNSNELVVPAYVSACFYGNL